MTFYYIYAYQPSSQTRRLKLGITNNLKNRQQTFRQVTPFGRMILAMKVSTRQAEKVLFKKLHHYRVKNEIFKMPVSVFELECAFLQTARETDRRKQQHYVLIDRVASNGLPK